MLKSSDVTSFDYDRRRVRAVRTFQRNKHSSADRSRYRRFNGGRSSELDVLVIGIETRKSKTIRNRAFPVDYFFHSSVTYFHIVFFLRAMNLHCIYILYHLYLCTLI